MTRSAAELFDFLPAGELLNVAEAILRVFADLGDYQHKARNRMKFLIRALGWDEWRAAFTQRLGAVRRDAPAALPFDPETAAGESAPAWPRRPAPDEASIRQAVVSAVTSGPGLHPERPVGPLSVPAAARWRTTNVRAQRQAGYAVGTVSVPLGDLTGAQLRVLADLSRSFGDGSVRVTATQNLLLRWVPDVDVDALYRGISAAGLGHADADTIADVTSCPGAESCKLAVTQSRGLGRTLEARLRSQPALIPLVPSLDVKVSGCPNGCGQHHVAAVGFQGSLRKVDGKAAPQYFVMAGGGVGPDGATFGRLVAKVPARRAGEALDRLARLFAAERRDGETAAAFFTRADLARLKALVADLEPLSTETAAADDFVDLGESTAFRPETQEGECSV
jgi:sulfite reductase (NADPH) hemoprotein beta-component